MAENIFFIAGMILFFAGLIAFGVWLVRWQYTKAERMLTNWARQNNYQITAKEIDDFDSSPMRKFGNKQVVYKVTLQNQQGNERKATIICGSPDSGVLDDSVQIKWNE